MKRHALAVVVLAGALCPVAYAVPRQHQAPGSTPARAAKAPAVDFSRDVRPILSKNCFACHGQDDGHRMASLRFDLRDAAVKPRGSRPAAIIPGVPQKSLLVERITAPDASRMPPASAGHRLSPEQVATLKAWIAQGAPYSEHWAFIAPKRPALPAVKLKAWPRNGLDYFVLAKLEAAGLKPAPEADRYTLLRRVSLDLRGLPPTPGEVDEFTRDSSPNWYGKAVDRFLADSAYGERWARVWLDLARYADSAGYGSDPLRMNIWPYRDWVINAFNRNEHYDQFTIEQIAGDLLTNATAEQKIATAFNRNTMTNTEGGTSDEEYRVAAIKDRVDTTLQVWMGLTVGCAKCHSHKFDPITQAEYYQLFAVFNQTTDNDQPNESPTMPVTPPAVLAEQKKVDDQVAALKTQLAAQPANAKALQDEVAKLEKSRPGPVQLPVMVELPADKHRETHLLIKNNYLDPGEKVEAGLPHAFLTGPENGPVDRLALARWVVDPKNPMTARVAVNRFWSRLFGSGIVETEEDFGTQGELPVNQPLLDWLAVSFETGDWGRAAGNPRSAIRSSQSDAWDVKQLLKEIVTSAAYRQSSRVSPEALAKDPRNRLLSHAPRYRLEAEMVRDQALQLSGLLSRKLGGPSVYPPQPDGLWQAAFNGERTYPTSTGEDRYRRGLYTFWRRSVPYPSMTTFDAPSREFCVVRRTRTNTPLQAFVTLNDPCYVEAAQSLARRIIKGGGATPESRAEYALKLCLCRPAQPVQVKAVTALFNAQREHYAKDAAAAKSLATEPLGALPEGIDTTDAAAWTVVANVLLNMDGVLTKG